MTINLQHKLSVAIAGTVCLTLSTHVGAATAATLTENFDDITTLPTKGWVLQNNSSPVGLTNWFQGNTSIFPAQEGAPASYIAANFNNTASTGTISNWLLSPVLNLRNGAVLSFLTRGGIDQTFPDRLEVRLSQNGAVSNVGSGSSDLGDFTQVLRVINPSLAPNTYPTDWRQYSVTINGLSAPAQGRIGFRYFVPNSGPDGNNGNYIGIDSFSYDPNLVAEQGIVGVPTPALLPGLIALGTAALRKRKAAGSPDETTDSV